MTTPFACGMSRATELTRSGRLDGGDGADFSSLLQPQPAAGNPTTGEKSDRGGDFTRLGDAPTTAAPARRSHIFARPSLGTRRKRCATSAAGGMPRRGPPAPEPLDLPEGALFLSLTHSGRHGNRDYRLYVPASRTDTPMPLIVMLHGCTQSPEDFAVGTGMNALAEEFRCLVAWPAQPQGCERPEMLELVPAGGPGAGGRGEPCLLAGIVHDIQRKPSSRSGSDLCRGTVGRRGGRPPFMGAAYPDLFCADRRSFRPAGSAGHRTCLRPSPPCAAASTGKARSLPVPAIVFHGLADATVHPGNGRGGGRAGLCGQSPGPKAAARPAPRPGGRTYRQTRHEDIDWPLDHGALGDRGCGPCLVRRAAGRGATPTLRARMLRAR